MARSTYVYVVLDKSTSHYGPVAAFTVKHELVTWLNSMAVVADRVEVWRIRDSAEADTPVRICVESLLNDPAKGKW